MPASHFDLIRRSMVILGFEEMPEDERPPRSMWLDDEALVAHFKVLKENRKGAAEGQPDGPMEQNSAARDLISG